MVLWQYEYEVETDRWHDLYLRVIEKILLQLEADVETGVHNGYQTFPMQFLDCILLVGYR